MTGKESREKEERIWTSPWVLYGEAQACPRVASACLEAEQEKVGLNAGGGSAATDKIREDKAAVCRQSLGLKMEANNHRRVDSISPNYL